MAAALLTCTTGVAQAQEVQYRPGRILVEPKRGLSESELTRALQRAGGRETGRVRALNVRVIEVPPAAEQVVMQALRRNPLISFAELDALLEPRQMAANDPRFGDAWHLPKVDLPAAWESNRGAGVTVAILDSGVDPNHLDLAANLLPGWNSADSSTNFADQYGHGTKVAGVVAAVSNNSLGVTSIAWDARILPIRITNRSDGLAYASDIARAITWAADNRARVANVSYDVGGSSTVASAAQYMKNLGGMVVHSAGNTGSDQGYPQRDSQIAVGATTGSDSRASWSSTGNHVDLTAPGTGIWTTTNGGGFGAPSGTSFSSPVVAGVLALVFSANPRLSPDEAAAVLGSTALDLGPSGWDTEHGHGRVNAAAAVAMAAGSDSGNDTTPPSVGILSPSAAAEVQGLVPVQVGANDDFGVSRVDLYVRGLLVASDETSPYEFVWDSSQGAESSAALSARAYDAAGNEGRSAEIAVSVTGEDGSNDGAAPQVSISSPGDGDIVSGNVSLSAFANDPDGINELRITVDGKLKCAGSPSATCGWNTRKESAGTHTVTATATDMSGNKASASVSVTVGGSSGSTKKDGGGGGGGGKGGGKGKK